MAIIQINGMAHGNVVKICGPNPRPKVNGPKGIPVLAPSAEIPPPMSAMTMAASKTFCSGNFRTRAASVAAVSSKIKIVSSQFEICGKKKVMPPDAKAAASKMVASQWVRAKFSLVDGAGLFSGEVCGRMFSAEYGFAARGAILRAQFLELPCFAAAKLLFCKRHYDVGRN